MTNKQWINNIDMQQEENWLADSVATIYVTNLEGYYFNKTKDRSTIMVGTGKVTKASARGDIIIWYPSSNQLIEGRITGS